MYSSCTRQCASDVDVDLTTALIRAVRQHHTAVADKGVSHGYAELDRLSAEIAGCLAERGTGPPPRVRPSRRRLAPHLTDGVLGRPRPVGGRSSVRTTRALNRAIFRARAAGIAGSTAR